MTVDAMELVEVPTGVFRMGSEENPGLLDERPEHEIDTPGFRIGQHPVSNAQFGEFVNDGGYDDPTFWTEAREAGFWQDGILSSRSSNPGGAGGVGSRRSSR